MGKQRQGQHFRGAVLRHQAGSRDDRVVRVATDGVGSVVAVFGGKNRGDMPDVRAPGIAGHVKLGFLEWCQSLRQSLSANEFAAEVGLYE